MGAEVLYGSAGFGDTCEGILLVSRQGFNARYDLDLENGVFSRPEHDLYGQSLAGRIFYFTSPKGGIATSWALRALAEHGLAPRALLCQEVNPIIVQGAVLARIALVSGIPPDAAARLRSGMAACIDPAQRSVLVLD